MSEPKTMADTKNLSQLHPGRGLGWMNLGASLHGILSRLKAQPHLYPQIQLSYSSDAPIREAVHIDLPKNDIRLRFDGPDQRLRLIEIIGWSQTTFTYKNTEIVRRSTQSDKPGDNQATMTNQSPLSGPSFRHVYNRLFGPAYAGEYLPPPPGSNTGVYILSYPGLAIRFPLKHSAYSDRADFVSLLSTAAAPATSIAVFSGSSWPEARGTLYTKTPPLPRSIALSSKNAETVPDEIENVVIHTGGRIELIRRSSPAFTIHLSQTSPQDLVAELGPPDAIFRKPNSRISIHAASQPNMHRPLDTSPTLHPSSVDTDRSSNTSLTSGMDDDSDTDNHNRIEDDIGVLNSDCFYNYFHHGFDILISHPTARSPTLPGIKEDPSNAQSNPNLNLENKLTATKLFLHGNIPGSYSFNRHRRSRWVIPLPPKFSSSASTFASTKPMAPSYLQHQKPRSGRLSSRDQSLDSDVASTFISKTSAPPPPTNPTHIQKPDEIQCLTSEMRFDQISQTLNTVWSSASASTTAYTSKGMVLNRGWTADDVSSPESSVELLGGTMTMDDNSNSNSNSTNSIISPLMPLSSSQRKPGANTISKTSLGPNTATGAGGGNTQLFGFPGLLFEVLDHGEISCVSIY